MEQSRKHLRISSWIILLFAALTVIQALGYLAWGDLNNAEIPDGAPENILEITKIFLLVVTVLFLLPEVYVGIKGLRMAKNPNSSKGHIIWAIIIFVFTLISLILPLVDIVKGDNVKDNIRTLLSLVLNASIYFDYIKYARLVAKEN